MGRQKGEAGRSKARPSSSSLAASLLPVDSTAVVGFGGYVGSSRLHSSVAGSRDDASGYSDIDSEFAQHLKRLARKDPITKLKALASLSALFKQKSGKDILPAIPQWAFEYKKLLLDYNREVRRATGDAMAHLVISVGRDLAPHLKSLMGPWWFSQFDPVSEASQAAKRSLQAAFPAAEKRLDALILCSTEIFTYLEENLKLTPQDLSDKASAPDELEEMHQQVISSSLLALATLLDVLVSLQSEGPSFENIAAEPKHASKARAIANAFAGELFSYHKCFVGFLKSQSSAIRSAAYSVLRSFIKNVPHVLSEENIKSLSPSVLGAFQEKDPTCHPSMWEVILLFSRRFPRCWTYLNVQKIVFDRFWYFLRNGCFGSHQVSYPALIIFLDSVPPQTIGESFLDDFFANFWTGRNASLSSNADQLAFFQAFKECFLWAVRNSSRYLDGADSLSHVRARLVENTLVKLLWEDFIHFPFPKNKRIIQGMSCETSENNNFPAQEKSGDTPIVKYPINYLHELGKCIIGILSGITLVENDLLSGFCSAFEEICQQMLMHSGNGEPEMTEQLIQFLSLLEQHAVRKGETWPLVHVVAPTLAEHFSTIESLDAPNSVRLLAASVTTFGAHNVFHVLSYCHGRPFCSDQLEKTLEPEQFISIFNERFVPWCLGRSDSYSAARIDLLLALLDDEYFPEQWSSVVSYAVKLESGAVGPGSLNPDCLAVLSILLQKARAEITKRKGSNYYQDSYADCWHHKLLDSAAVAVISSLPPFQKPATEFLHLALGGSTENDQTMLLSRDALILISKNILEKLTGFILDSPLTWVREAASLLRIRETKSPLADGSSGDVIETAKFALEILCGSLYALMKLDEQSELLSYILAAIFIISWECSVEGLLDEALDYELKNMKARFEISKTLHTLCFKIDDKLCQNLDVHTREKLRIILAQFIRYTISREQKLDPDKLTALCCTWMLAVLDCFCVGHHEEQHLLEQLLCKGDGWPIWISEDTFTGLTHQNIEEAFLHSNISKSHKFVSLVDKLIQKRGISTVLGSSTLHPSSPNVRVESTSRAWLAAEILCTWEWPGGSVATSFLPMFSLYVKNYTNPPLECGLLDSILDILLDAALVQGKFEVQNFSVAWLSSVDELEHTEEPVLRALISLLATLFRENIWGKYKARTLFELLANKLFIGATVNVHCLRILPPIVSALVQTIYRIEVESREELQVPSTGEDLVQITIIHWLERALSFPPLLMEQSGQDMEEWFQLVIFCYPINATDRLQAPKPERSISLKERTLLLDLFRKQRHGIGMLTSCDQRQSSLMLLSRLVAISACYCGDDFAEEDWEFVLSHVKIWIQLAVVMMEDVAENVNDLVTNISTRDNLDTIVSKLGNIVFIKDIFRICVGRNAILAFSSFSRHQELKDVNSLSSLASERWAIIKDRILEGILRLLFCTGLAEAIANSYSREGASAVASSRLCNLFFWKLVSWSAIGSSQQCRGRALKSVEFWALSRDSISSLYAILFSATPTPPLQFAAYVILSTEPISQVAMGEFISSNLDSDQDSGNVDLLSEQSVHFRKEISFMIEKLPHEILEKDLMAPERVHILLSWCVFLSHLWSLPLSSPTRERLVQHIQNSANTVILDCLFQHIFLELDTVTNLRKREELPAGLCEAANMANEAITTGSVLPLIESFWPVEQHRVTSLAGAIFGMMLRLLPAYVRGWFSNLRDRSASTAVESFTRTWCSPPLITNELSQIKRASFVDENFSVSVSKAANEVVATYTKDETGVDLVIRLPASYPLRPVDVDCTRSLGISELKQRKWLMSMMLFLSNQNGAIAEAIRIWKCNFDKEFEGVEECPICYSVIHTANHSLPRVACKTCKHKYHSACLNKWFSTSNKRNCPLCQSVF